MFDKFCDYMYYLLTSPLKRVKKSINQWYILFRVLGRRFDDALESLYNAEDQTMLATCEPEMLPVHAEDRKMARYPGEEDENFRARIANYPEILRLGGTDAGIIIAIKSLGFENVDIVKAKILRSDESRWAEFYVIIKMDADMELPIGYDAIKKEVRKTKQVTALDNYLFLIYAQDRNSNHGMGRCIIKATSKVKSNQSNIIIVRHSIRTEMQTKAYLEIKNDLWFFDGKYMFDGSKNFDAYRTREEL
ncbi:MAG: phage tail protein [Roseburia sp.]|nr:phage tail protein [Roseburia sp.]